MDFNEYKGSGWTAIPKDGHKPGQTAEPIRKFNTLTAQEQRDVLYMPMLLTMVAFRYVEELRMQIWGKMPEAKVWSRILDKAHRTFIKECETCNIGELDLKTNVKRLRTIFEERCPCDTVYGYGKIPTEFSVGFKQVLERLLPYRDAISEYGDNVYCLAYFTYRITHLACQAEGTAIASMTDTDMEAWQPSGYLIDVATTCADILEYGVDGLTLNKRRKKGFDTQLYLEFDRLLVPQFFESITKDVNDFDVL